MQRDDLEQVLAVERRACAFPWTLRNFSDCLQMGYCSWVYRHCGGLAGHGVLMVAAGEAHLLNLCIDPAYQRRGLGKGMLDHLLRLGRRHGAATVFLEVRASNQGARRLYFEAGFNEIGLRKNYYPAKQGREAAVVLACELM